MTKSHTKIKQNTKNKISTHKTNKVHTSTWLYAYQATTVLNSTGGKAGNTFYEVSSKTKDMECCANITEI
jgi:hypothetical protein